MSSLLSVLVLSLLSLQWASVAAGGGGGSGSGTPMVSYETWTLPVAHRGISCAAARYYPPNGASYPFIALQGNSTSNFWDSPFYITDGNGGWYYGTSIPQGLEGNFLHSVYSVNDGNLQTLVGGGVAGNFSGGTPSPIWYIDSATGTWVQWNSSSTLYPIIYRSWNWTYTPVMNTLSNSPDPSYLTLIYGGWIVHPDGHGEFDNHFYVIPTQTDTVTDKLIAGLTSPFTTARMGVAMASFNDSTNLGYPRGQFVVIGGLEWQSNVFYNDVWVGKGPVDGTWTSYGNAPFSPRYSAQAFEGGRGGIFIYGGMGPYSTWYNDLWYGQFDTDPSSGVPPVWSSITPSGSGGPSYTPSCSIAWWYDDHTLYLVSMGSHTNTPYDARYIDPKNTVWLGKVDYP